MRMDKFKHENRLMDDNYKIVQILPVQEMWAVSICYKQCDGIEGSILDEELLLTRVHAMALFQHNTSPAKQFISYLCRLEDMVDYLNDDLGYQYEGTRGGWYCPEDDKLHWKYMFGTRDEIQKNHMEQLKSRRKNYTEEIQSEIDLRRGRVSSKVP